MLLAISIALSVAAVFLPWFRLTGHVKYIYIGEFLPSEGPTITIDACFNRYPFVDDQSCGLNFEYLSQVTRQTHQTWRSAGWIMLFVAVLFWLALGLVHFKESAFLGSLGKIGLLLIPIVLATTCIALFVESRSCQYETYFHMDSISAYSVAPLVSLTGLVLGGAALATALLNKHATEGI